MASEEEETNPWSEDQASEVELHDTPYTDAPSPQRRASPTVAFDKALDNILKLGTHDLTIEEDTLVVLGI